jgi:hypothetical protein
MLKAEVSVRLRHRRLQTASPETPTSRRGIRTVILSSVASVRLQDLRLRKAMG